LISSTDHKDNVWLAVLTIKIMFGSSTDHKDNVWLAVQIIKIMSG